MRKKTNEELIVMVEARRKYMREYARQWRRRNPQRAKAIRERYNAKQTDTRKDDCK